MRIFIHPKSKNAGIYFIISIIIAGLIYFKISNGSSDKNTYLCNAENKFSSNSFRGTVKEKFFDTSNRNKKTVILLKDDLEIEKLIFSLDGSGFFEKVDIGDSISKDVNSMIINVKQLVGKSYNVKIDFGCKKEDNHPI